MIDILLATYNSSRYLREQVESVIAQDYQDWHLLIRDGGSSDNTLEIIRKLCIQEPKRIQLVPFEGKASALKNFSALLEISTAPYIMFCDHDDIWFKDKVSKSMEKMKELEKQFGIDSPYLVFTDKIVVDDVRKVIAHSYFKMVNINPRRFKFQHLLLQNIPSGCTMLINRALYDVAKPIPLHAVMHDHWLALTASIFAHTAFLDKPTMLYRQHDGNIFGAQYYGLGYLIQKLLFAHEKIPIRFLRNVEQASIFLSRFKNLLPQNEQKCLEDFSHLLSCNIPERYRIIICNRIYKNGLLRNMGMFFVLPFLGHRYRFNKKS